MSITDMKGPYLGHKMAKMAQNKYNEERNIEAAYKN